MYHITRTAVEDCAAPRLTYKCKGVVAERVAWIYDDPKPGWEHIQGQYGFYAGETAAKFGKTEDALSPT